MKIKLDDTHYLNSDAFCCWITCEYTIKSGKGTGSIAERNVSGFLPTLEMAVERYIEKKILSSKATKFSDLAREIKDIKKTVKAWKVTLEELKEIHNEIPDK